MARRIFDKSKNDHDVDYYIRIYKYYDHNKKIPGQELEGRLGTIIDDPAHPGKKKKIGIDRTMHDATNGIIHVTKHVKETEKTLFVYGEMCKMSVPNRDAIADCLTKHEGFTLDGRYSGIYVINFAECGWACAVRTHSPGYAQIIYSCDHITMTESVNELTTTMKIALESQMTKENIIGDYNDIITDKIYGGDVGLDDIYHILEQITIPGGDASDVWIPLDDTTGNDRLDKMIDDGLLRLEQKKNTNMMAGGSMKRLVVTDLIKNVALLYKHITTTDDAILIRDAVEYYNNIVMPLT